MTPTGPKTVIELPTATDNCGGVISGSTDERTFDEPGSHVVTWTYTDGSGNTSTQTQTVIVTGNDTAAPVPDVANLPTVTGECEVTVNPPTATDNCAGTVTATTPDQLTYTAAGTYTIHWTYSDGTGNTSGQNQTVVVTDVQAPTIALDGPSSVTIECHTTYVDPGVTTADNCAPENVHVTTTGLPNTNVLGTYTVTYTATDSGGNQASVQRTVIVQDTTAPTITAPANVTVGTGPGASTCSTVVSDAQLGNATAGDNCSVTVTRSGVPAGNIFPKGNTTVTYTATDGGGNTATATQVVTVNDTTLPTISCQANIVADFDGAVNGAVVTYTTPAGADNCAGATTTQIAGLPSGATFPAGTTTNTFRVTDASGNAAECSFNVTVAVTSLIGLDSVTITGSAFADSYNSGGGYPATKTSLANVLSNGTITMGNSAKVWGNVRSTRAGVNMTGATNVTGNATAGTTVATSGSATVSGTRTNNALAPVMTLPPVSACAPFSPNSGISGTYSYNASTGDLTLSGVNIATLANGTYCFHNVTLGNSAQLKVNGPVVIKLTGTLNTSGATFINNTTQIPSNLRILSSYSGSNGVVLGNSASIYSVIYAPNTGLNISGAAPLFGTAAGKSITLGGSGAIHYDTTLLSIWPALWTLIVGP
jgi:hypothetical protein